MLQDLRHASRSLRKAPGFSAAGALARTMQAAIPEVAPFDPVSFASAAAALMLAALTACIVPALRATRVDPAEVLRH